MLVIDLIQEQDKYFFDIMKHKCKKIKISISKSIKIMFLNIISFTNKQKNENQSSKSQTKSGKKCHEIFENFKPIIS